MPEPQSRKPNKELSQGDVYDGLTVKVPGGGHLEIKPAPRFSSKQITLAAVSFIGAAGAVFLTKYNAQPICLPCVDALSAGAGLDYLAGRKT